MSARPFKVLVVSEHRKLLRHLSHFLNVFGYSVQQAADGQQARAAVEAQWPDLLVVDEELASQGALELCRALGRQDELRYVYKLLLIRDAHPQALTEALEAGVDDFLSKPIVHGEILTRLRVGARVLEFERRVREQATHGPLHGCLSASELMTRLRRELDQASRESKTPACVMIDLDLFQRFSLTQGRGAAEGILQDVAKQLGSLCEKPTALAYLGDNRFCAMLPGNADPADWAEQVRKTLEQTPRKTADGTTRLTASLGVAQAQRGSKDPHDVLQKAEHALRLAKSSGRNCVARYGQYDDESKAWADLAAPGKLFRETVARDVMVPCTAVLRLEDPRSRAEALFQRTQLDALPVVDTHGKLLGAVFHDARHAKRGDCVRDMMITNPPSFDELATFATLMDCCTRHLPPLIIIVHDEKPTGVVSPGQLATLSDPLTSETFAPSGLVSASSDYLLIKDGCAQDCA